MRVFLDTSALVALVDRIDVRHANAARTFAGLAAEWLMRRERIDTAFAFDRHFSEQGFARIP